MCSSAQEAHSVRPLTGKRRVLSSFFLHCSSNMKRAASLNYLNQPNAAPLQVRVVPVSLLVGEQERVAMEQVPQELGKRRKSSGMKTPARGLQLSG